MLVLREVLLVGRSGFGEFQNMEEGIASNILAERLSRLEQAGLLRREAVKDDGRQVRYVPTAAARTLVPVLVEMAYWGATHDAKTAAPKAFVQAYEKDRAGLIAMIMSGADARKA